MASKLGENIQREWDAEPHAVELWEAHRALKSDRAIGLSLLTDLANSGSALAMMYLGHAYAVSKGDENEVALGEQWLIQSANSGSIEGRYQLAHHYFRQRVGSKMIPELEGLSKSGYSPAMYALGSILHKGELCARSVDDAIAYLRMAAKAGHLPSVGLLSQIYRKEPFGLLGRIKSHWLCFFKIPAVAWYVWHYPNSDRLRGLNLRQAL